MRSAPTARRCFVVFLLGCTWPTLGQAPQAFEETIDVDLIEVDVRVTTSDGQPVSGLQRESFSVRVDGRRVEISHFAATEAGRPVPKQNGDSSSSRPPSTRDDRIHLVVYVDHAHLEPGELGDVLAAVRTFLRQSLAPGDRVMVAEANHDLTVTQPFTPVAELAIAALESVKPQAPRTHGLGELTELLTEMERKVQEGPNVLARSRNTGPQDFKVRIDGFAVRNYQELERTTRQLHRLLPALAGLPGQRVLVYVGGTPPTEAGRTLLNAWRSAFGAGSRYQLERDSSSGVPGNSLAALDATGGGVSEIDAERLFGTVAQIANDYGVTLYALDTGGLRSGRGHITGQDTPGIKSGGGAHGGSGGLSRRIGHSQSLRVMAEETGGRAAINTRAFGHALAILNDDLRNRYTLAFPPPAAKRKDKTGGDRLQLDIRLKGEKRKLTLRYPQSLRRRSADYLAADRTISALLVGVAANPLDVTITAQAPRKGERATWIVPLTVTIPIDRLELVPADNALTGQLSLYFSSGDLGRGAAEVKKARVPLHLAMEAVSGEAGQRIEYPLDLPVAAGSAAVAVTVRDDLRPLSSTVRTAIPPPETVDGSR